MTRRAPDGSDAGAWVRRAHATAAGTRAASPDQRQLKSSAPELSTGSGCWQSCTTVPGKAVSSWTGELGEQPILTACAVSAHTLLQLIYLLLLALQVSAWTGFFHHYGPNQGTRRRVLCRAAMHSVASQRFACCAAGELSQPGPMVFESGITIMHSQSASGARREVRRVLSSPSYAPRQARCKI